ncbi:ATP-dependent DNA helicase RecG-like, partial [Ylistrum balloti]|uniref:ATP-dependent DNA helicase RecG-like n=1 Tax=Ylistrum balloti TaxID=509963 RepID=UPI002905C16F
MSVFSDLDTPLIALASLSKLQKEKLEFNGLYLLKDLVGFLPVEYEERGALSTLDSIKDPNASILIAITVHAHSYLRFKNKGAVLKVCFHDSKENIGELHCYGREFIKDVLPVGSQALIWGKFTRPKYRNTVLSSSKFEIIRDKRRVYSIVPRYRTLSKISQTTFYSLMQKTMLSCDIAPLHNYTEHAPHSSITRKEAIQCVHSPSSLHALEQARETLAFDETLLFQLSLALQANKTKEIRTNIRKQRPALVQDLRQALPFSLTQSQVSVIDEIHNDLFSQYPMRRLLQGDVGSGKTIVAFITALSVLENDEQVILVVPSEALAQQHYRRIAEYMQLLTEKLPTLRLHYALLTGSTSKKEREQLFKQIEKQEIQLVIGTHALYSSHVEYKNLTYIIIDEQHRFGVEQRKLLLNKGKHCDVLLMSATPIPRTLALTVYSDLHVSTLKEKPGIQHPPRNRIISLQKRGKMYPHILHYLQKGEQVFCVFPQIGSLNEKKDIVQMSSLLTMYDEIQKQLSPYSVALLHSKIPYKEQLETMKLFEQKKISTLLCTTIVE